MIQFVLIGITGIILCTASVMLAVHKDGLVVFLYILAGILIIITIGV